MNIEAIVERRGRPGTIVRVSYDPMPMPLGAGTSWPIDPASSMTLGPGGPEWTPETAPRFTAGIVVAIIPNGSGSDMPSGSASFMKGHALIPGASIGLSGWPIPPRSGDIITCDGREWIIRDCAELHWFGQVTYKCNVES